MLEGERVRRGSIKRVKLVPDVGFSDQTFPAESFVAGPTAATVDTTATAVNNATSNTTAVESTQKQPASPPAASSSSPLPVIHRGLRASRIVPVADAENASEGQPRRRPREEGSSAQPLEKFMDDRRRVYPSESLPVRGGHDEDQELDSGGGSGDGPERWSGGKKSRISPRPAVTNLDLSSSLTATSSTSTLPPLELEVVALPSLPPTPSSPSNGRAAMTPGGESERADKPGGGGGGGGNPPVVTAAAAAAMGGDIESNLIAVPAGTRHAVDSEQSRHGDRAEGSASSAEEGAVAVAMVEAEAEAADLEKNISLGRQHAEDIRDRLRRTFSPQGVEVTTVMVCSAELPSHIAEQMSGRTLNASLAEEQRAVKRSESQKVRHEGEVLGLRQRCEIEKALVLREGEREVTKVRFLGCGTGVCVCVCARLERA